MSSHVYKEEFSATPVTLQNVERDNFNVIGVFEKTTFIGLKSINGLNIMRNNIVPSGNGNVTMVGNEYKLNVTTSSDTILLESKEKGKYVPGKSCSLGMGLRIPSPLVGDQTVCWGYFNNDNGFYFKKTSTNFFVCIKKDGVETAIPRSQFNIDKVDGSGGSSKTLDFTAGNIFRIKFSWYGYGCVEFGVIGGDYFNIVKLLPLHMYQTIGHTSVTNPSLPLSISVSNGTTNSNCDIYVAGRSFDIMGSYNPVYRHNGVNVQNISCSSTLKPVLNIRKKSNSEYYSISILLRTVYLKTDNDIYLEIRTDPTLTNTNYINLQSEAETSVEYDISADSVSSGLVVWCGIISSTTNVINFPEHVLVESCSVCVKSLSSTATLSYLHLNWDEDW